MRKNRVFPALGRSWDEVNASITEARKDDLPWHSRKIFKPAYYAGDDVVEVANRAFDLYMSENALYGGTSYPSLKRFETECIRMTLELLGGSVSAGGTESNIMAVKTARDWARIHKPRATAPEMVVARTAHPSFNKGAHMLGVKVVRMKKSVDWVADVDAMAAAVNDNTIMVVGSAPPYPYGVVDPITEIAAIAQRHGLWMHVDGCLGAMVLPFARKLGEPIPDFDFTVPGVTSISGDLHKFGYANKGVSVLLLRDAGLEAYQRSTFDEWPSGTYSTPNIVGSRSGGAVASAWAVMNYLGEEGYLRIAGALIAIKKRLIAGINAIDGLEVWGTPHGHHITFGSRSVDIMTVGDGMEERGWMCGRGTEPPYLLLFLNMAHTDAVDDYLSDLAGVVKAVKAGKVKRRATEAVYAV